MNIPKTPHKISDERLKIAYDFAKLGERLVEIKKFKAIQWLELRKFVKSDAQAEREWELTELGIEEMEIKAKMKAKQMKSSALRTHLEVLKDESHNQY